MNPAQPATEYRLYLSWVIRLMMYLPGIIFVPISVFLFTASFWNVGRNPPPWFVGLFPLFGIAAIYLQLALIPYRIRWREDGAIDFVAWARTRTVRLEDLVSIKPDTSQVGFLRFKHRKGSFRLFPQFDGFHEFLTRVKTANPGIEMRGC